MPAPRLGRAAAQQAVHLAGVAAEAAGRVQLPGADAGQFVCLFHAGLGLVAAQLGQVLGGAVDGDQQAGVVAVVVDRVRAQFHLPAAAIAQLQRGAQHADLLGRLADRLQLVLQDQPVAGWPQHVDGLLQQRVALPAEGQAGGRVGVEDGQAVQVVDQDRSGVALEHLPQAQLRALQARMGAQHMLGQRAQQQVQQAGAGEGEEGVLHGLPERQLPRVRYQCRHGAIGGDHPGQRQHQIGQHHPTTVTTQRLRHLRVGSGGGAGRFCGHGQGRGRGRQPY